MEPMEPVACTARDDNIVSGAKRMSCKIIFNRNNLKNLWACCCLFLRVQKVNLMGVAHAVARRVQKENILDVGFEHSLPTGGIHDLQRVKLV